MSRDLGVLKNLKFDLPSSIVVFLVALPLCLGIALASLPPEVNNIPTLFVGIISGVIGGIIVGTLSGSSLSVSGPAAGLSTIVFHSILDLNSYTAFLMAVVLAGVMQLILGLLRAGTIGNYFPSSVIKGMLSAIGITLILNQIPHAVGYDKDYEGNIDFWKAGGGNTFTELFHALESLTPSAIIIAFLSLATLILWELPVIKKSKFAGIIPAPLLVVAGGIGLNELFGLYNPELRIQKEHLVNLPVAEDLNSFVSQFSFPSFSAIFNPIVWKIAFTIAVVASLETLLSIDAIDKLDPYKRISPLNKELKAQGIANMFCGLIGGLPITSVIVRSSANVSAGGRTKTATISHGMLLLLSVLLVPGLLNKIPYASLAAILLMVGYKLAKPALFVSMYKKGFDQFIPFLITIVAILFSNLLIGITIGISVGLLFILRTNFHQALFTVTDNGNYLIRLTRDVSFLNKALLRRTFRSIPEDSYVIIDGSRSSFIDRDILETIEDFQQSAPNKNITIELKYSISASNSAFKAKEFFNLTDDNNETEGKDIIGK